MVYLSILFLFTTFLSWQKAVRGDLVLICFYLLGSGLAALIVGRGDDVSFLTFIFHFIVFAVVVVFYLVVDWRLAKAFNQLKSTPPKSKSSQE